jgi:hypothetical protein
VRLLLGFLIGVVVGAAAVGGWWYWTEGRSDGGPGAEEQRLARAYAGTMVSLCERAGEGDDCELAELNRVAPNVWRARLDPSSRNSYCILIQLERFRRLADGSVTGALESECG